MKIELRDTTEDQTREVRNYIQSDSELNFEGEAITHGMLPEDLDREYGGYGKIGNIGMGKIIPIVDKKNLKITGGKFNNPKHAFELPNEIIGTRRHHTVSQLSFLHLVDCDNIHLENIQYQGPHFYERGERPQFIGSYEFAHGIEIENSENVFIKDLKFSNTPGDFVYFRAGGKRPNKNITILNSTIDFNGRQGIAWGDGQNILIDNVSILNSGRGGIDIEPPKDGYVAKNIIVRNSFFNTALLPVPMGGLGEIENVLIENNEWTTSGPNTYILADRVNSIRKNIIFRGNKRLSGYGSANDGVIVAHGAENLLIENEYALVKPLRSLIAIHLNNCTGVVIRNNDFPNAKYIVLRDTPVSEVKVYGNKQDMEFVIYEYSMPFMVAPDLKDFAHYGRQDWEKWAEARNEWLAYMKERELSAIPKTVPIEQYDVEKYGEPDVPKDPDFIPYMGVDAVEPEPTEPETPVEEGSEETPGFPEEEGEETPEAEKVEKTWYQNKALWVIGGIALILIITALL